MINKKLLNILFMFLLIAFFGQAYAKTMDVSYKQIMWHLDGYFAMEKARYGQERYFGGSKMGILEIIGNKNAVIETSVILYGNLGSYSAHVSNDAIKENKAIMLKFLYNLFPNDNKTVLKWVKNAMHDAIQEQTHDPYTNNTFVNKFGNKKVSVAVQVGLGLLMITVKSA